jgi:hypothetical protein
MPKNSVHEWPKPVEVDGRTIVCIQNAHSENIRLSSLRKRDLALWAESLAELIENNVLLLDYHKHRAYAQYTLQVLTPQLEELVFMQDLSGNMLSAKERILRSILQIPSKANATR